MRGLNRFRALRAASKLGIAIPHYARGVGFWLVHDDAISRSAYLDGGFEPEVATAIRAFVSPGMTVCDIGAHEGYFSLLLSRLVGADGQVLAFEPSPRQARRLRTHMRLNRRRNVRLHQTALGAEDSTARLYVPSGVESGCNSLRLPNLNEPMETVDVAVTTLDFITASQGVRKIDFIKLDVEGAELTVIQGAAATLATSRPVILCELSDQRTAPWGYPSSAIFDAVVDAGYDWYELSGASFRRAQRASSFNTNLLAVPRERQLPQASGRARD